MSLRDRAPAVPIGACCEFGCRRCWRYLLKGVFTVSFCRAFRRAIRRAIRRARIRLPLRHASCAFDLQLCSDARLLLLVLKKVLLRPSADLFAEPALAADCKCALHVWQLCAKAQVVFQFSDVFHSRRRC